ALHPTRHTLHTPYRAYRTLAELCTVLERDFALEPVNHQPRGRSAEGRAADLEHHTGIESLVGWIRRTCLDALRAALTWGALHPILREQGLELRAHANGFIFEAADGTCVKASTVARDLSKPKLEARLGPFAPASEPCTEPRRPYPKPPLRLRVNIVQVYARYQAERQRHVATLTGAWQQARDRKHRRIEAAKRSNGCCCNT
ncbi:MAG: conjugal transfer protein TraI, partial [Gammaproteobacteria bacterium]